MEVSLEVIKKASMEIAVGYFKSPHAATHSSSMLYGEHAGRVVALRACAGLGELLERLRLSPLFL